MEGYLIGGLALLLFLSVTGWIWTIVRADFGKGKPTSSFEEDGRWYYVYQVLNDRRFPDQLFFLIQGGGSEPRCVVTDRSQVTGTLVRGDCWVRTYQTAKKKPRVVEIATGDGHAPPSPRVEEGNEAGSIHAQHSAAKR